MSHVVKISLSLLAFSLLSPSFAIAEAAPVTANSQEGDRKDEESMLPVAPPLYFLEQLAADKESEEKWRAVVDAEPENAAAHLNLGIALQGLRLNEAAEASYQEAIRLLPTDAAAYTALAKLLARDSDRFDQSLSLFQQAAKLAPDDGEVQFNLANALYLLPAYEDVDVKTVEAIYREAIQLSPGNENIYYELSKALFTQSRFDEAAATMRSLLSRQPENIEALWMLVDILNQSQDEQAYESVYREAIARSPNSPSLYVNLANLLYGQDEAAGRAIYQEAIRRFPQDDEAYWVLSRSLAQTDALDEAITVLRSATVAGASSSRLYQQLGKLLAMQGDSKAAEIAFKEAIAIEPQEVDAYRALGDLYKALGRNQEAIAAYQSAESIEFFEGTASELAQLLLTEERYAEAEAVYRAVGVSFIDPEQTIENWQTALRALGREAEAEAVARMFQAGRFNEREAVYRAAIQISPQTGLYHGELAAILANEGNPAEAEVSYQEALRLNSYPFMNTVGLGKALFDQGKLVQAEAVYKEALAFSAEEKAKVDPYYLSQLYQNLGELYLQQGMLAAALSSYQKALEFAPEDGRIQDKITELKTQMAQ